MSPSNNAAWIMEKNGKPLQVKEGKSPKNIDAVKQVFACLRRIARSSERRIEDRSKN
jgi:hypothetical protein